MIRLLNGLVSVAIYIIILYNCLNLIIRCITNASWNCGLSSWTVSAGKKKIRQSAAGFLDRNADGIVLGRQWVPLKVRGVDEPAPSTDVFYGFALFLDPSSPLILTHEDNGMRFAEPLFDPTIAICGCKISVIVTDIRGKVNALKLPPNTHHFDISYFFFATSHCIHVIAR